MRANRLIRKRGKKRQRNVLDLDITSLLDILVIMLVFLLKSYNASGIVLNVPKGIILPKSDSQAVNSTGVNIQVSPDKIWVDDQEIVDLNRPKSRLYDHDERRIIPLYNELVKKKQLVKRVHHSAPNAKSFSGIANLIVDKSLNYRYLKKIMYTCAEAGFKQYKFVVLGEE